MTRVLLAGPLLVALILHACLATDVAASDDAQSAASEHDRVAVRLAFNRRTLGDEYQRVGKRNPKWDEAASAFLDGMARYFSANRLAAWYRISHPGRDTLNAQAEHLITELGCDDPLVLYCYVVVATGADANREQRDRISSLALEAYDELLKSDYNGFRKTAAASRAASVAATLQDEDLRGRADADAFRLAVDVFNGRDLLPGEAQLLLEFLWEPRKEAAESVAELKPFVDAVANSETHEWAALVVRGDYRRAAAWEHRGSAVARLVTPEGWEGWHREMARAAEVYVRAHELHPERPEAAAGLITVASAGLAPAGTDERFWFDAAMAAQIDYEPAWHAYGRSLLPRWGGSHEQMLEHGRYALATQRFDTDVPQRLGFLVQSIARDRDYDWQVVRDLDPTIWEDLERMYAGTIAYLVENGRWNARHFAAERLALAWALHQWEDAATLVNGGEEAGADSSNFRVHEFAQVGVPARYAINEILAKAEEDPGTLEQIERLDDVLFHGEAAAGWEHMLQRLDAASPARPYVESRLRQSRLLHQLQTAPDGEWIDVPLDLDHWEAVQGEWRLVDGKLVGTVVHDHRSGTEGWGKAVAPPQLVLLAMMPAGYEVRVAIESVTHGEEDCSSAFVNISPAWGAGDTGSVGLRLQDQNVRVHYASGNVREGRTPVQGATTTLRASVGGDGEVRTWVGDTEVARVRGIIRRGTVGLRRVAIGSEEVHLGDKITIDHVQIRRKVDPDRDAPGL